MSFWKKIFGGSWDGTSENNLPPGVSPNDTEIKKEVLSIGNILMSSKNTLGSSMMGSLTAGNAWALGGALNSIGANMFSKEELQKLQDDQTKIMSDFIMSKLNIKQECLDILNIKIQRFDADDQTIRISIADTGVDGWLKGEDLQKICDNIQNLFTKIEMLEALNKDGLGNQTTQRRKM